MPTPRCCVPASTPWGHSSASPAATVTRRSCTSSGRSWERRCGCPSRRRAAACPSARPSRSSGRARPPTMGSGRPRLSGGCWAATASPSCPGAPAASTRPRTAPRSPSAAGRSGSWGPGCPSTTPRAPGRCAGRSPRAADSPPSTCPTTRRGVGTSWPGTGSSRGSPTPWSSSRAVRAAAPSTPRGSACHRAATSGRCPDPSTRGAAGRRSPSSGMVRRC